LHRRRRILGRRRAGQDQQQQCSGSDALKSHVFPPDAD
jgi:hypothetical protein